MSLTKEEAYEHSRKIASQVTEDVNSGGLEQKAHDCDENDLAGPHEPRRPFVVEVVPIEDQERSGTTHDSVNTSRGPQGLGSRLNSQRKGVPHDSGEKEVEDHFFGSQKDFEIRSPNDHGEGIEEKVDEIGVNNQGSE